MSTRTWYKATQIAPEHSLLAVKQVYVWIWSADNKFVLVRGKKDWQFPGGKPEAGESIIETAIRESHEEAGINLVPAEIKFFGYHVVSGDGPLDYLQVRTFTRLNRNSPDLHLIPAEPDSEKNPMLEAAWFSVAEAESAIHWLAASAEKPDAISLVGIPE